MFGLDELVNRAVPKTFAQAVRTTEENASMRFLETLDQYVKNHNDQIKPYTDDSGTGVYALGDSYIVQIKDKRNLLKVEVQSRSEAASGRLVRRVSMDPPLTLFSRGTISEEYVDSDLNGEADGYRILLGPLLTGAQNEPGAKYYPIGNKDDPAAKKKREEYKQGMLRFTDMIQNPPRQR